MRELGLAMQIVTIAAGHQLVAVAILAGFDEVVVLLVMRLGMQPIRPEVFRCRPFTRGELVQPDIAAGTRWHHFPVGVDRLIVLQVTLRAVMGATMPTVLRLLNRRFHFYSDEGHELQHIHVRTPDGECKFWLAP